MDKQDIKVLISCMVFMWALLSLCFYAILSFGSSTEEPKVDEYVPEAVYYEDVRDKDWEIFTEALIWVESKGDERAVGKKDDIGVLQITPILLQDCNRILGYEKYNLNDRYNRDKSIEMFNLIQGHYNPQHDYHWALKLWNSGAPLSYHRKVMDKFNEFKNTTR